MDGARFDIRRRSLYVHTGRFPCHFPLFYAAFASKAPEAAVCHKRNDGDEGGLQVDSLQLSCPKNSRWRWEARIGRSRTST
eukprot:scaffold36729_cov31-Tisochrysis_lutea.AAC.1